MKKSVRVLSPSQRIAVTVAAAALIMVATGMIYLWVIVPAISGNPGKPISAEAAARIAAASKAYAHALQAREQPVPASLPLTDLVKFGLLKPQDISAFEGLDATITPQTNDTIVAGAVLMHVHMSDGSDVVLLADGSVQEVSRH